MIPMSFQREDLHGCEKVVSYSEATLAAMRIQVEQELRFFQFDHPEIVDKASLIAAFTSNFYMKLPWKEDTMDQRLFTKRTGGWDIPYDKWMEGEEIDSALSPMRVMQTGNEFYTCIDKEMLQELGSERALSQFIACNCPQLCDRSQQMQMDEYQRVLFAHLVHGEWDCIKEGDIFDTKLLSSENKGLPRYRRQWFFQKLLGVYIRLRAVGYTHRDLAI